MHRMYERSFDKAHKNPKQQGARTIVYTAGGALIGSAFVPPIGTVLGGVIGLSVGVIRGVIDDILKLKEERERLRNHVN